MNLKIFKKKRTRDPICSFLKKLISPYGFGWQDEDGGVGRFSNDRLIHRYNTYGYMGTPNQGDLYSHFAGQITLYFWADGRKSTPQTLSMIDIDYHKTGNAESAKAFAEWLSRNGFPGLYHEPSTHGKGRHGYFVLSKEGFTAIAVSNALKQLEKVLKTLLRVFLATHPQYEVEDVEVKGTPHLITWAKGDGRRIESMKSGALAKIPRDILDRFDEFKNTTSLSLYDIEELEEMANRLLVASPRRTSTRQVRGSTGKHPLRKSEVRAIHGPYLEFARSCVTEALPTSSRAKVDPLDLAIGLAIVKYCTSNLNSDGTMPTGRIKGIWDGLHRDKEIHRAFDYHRWRVVRDLMEAQGGLEMVDRRFYTGFIGRDGERIGGRAARWHMAGWLMEKLDELAEETCENATRREELLNPSAQVAVSMPIQAERETLLEQEEDTPGTFVLPATEAEREALLEQETNHAVVDRSLPTEAEREALLEQDEEPDLDDLFDKTWIIELRRWTTPTIGLIWAGSVEALRREAG